MSKPTIYGFPLSTFVRATRLVCHEKGVDYDLIPATPHSDELGGRHPFGKIPAFEHGDVTLFESLAIMTYVDETFDGPVLQPADALGRARMLQWISAYNDAIFGAAFAVALNRFIRPVLQQVPGDEAAVEEALPRLAHGLAVLNGAVSDSPYFAGDALTMADCAIYPMVWYMPVLGCADLMADNPALSAWAARMRARPGTAASEPDMPAAA